MMLVVSIITVLGGWGYAIHEYGWFMGLAFGWIPASIIAAMILGVFWVVYFAIPKSAPNLIFVPTIVSFACRLGFVALIAYAVFWVLRVLGVLLR